MVRQGLNCADCSFREWDGFDNVCTAYLDKHEGKPVVQTVDGWLPLWCPLNQPRRIEREELENVIPKTTKAALVMMHIHNGDEAPEHLVDEITDARYGREGGVG